MTTIPRQTLNRFILAPLTVALLCAGCGTPFSPLPGPVQYGRSAKDEGTLGTATTAKTPTGTVIEKMPGQLGVRPGAGSQPTPIEDRPPSPGSDEQVTIAIEQTPLPMFIQILYGNILKRAYSLDPAVTARTEPVTFKTSRPISKARMEVVAANLLRSYGLAVIELDGLVRIAPEATNNNTSLRVQTGKKLPDGADPFRPVYQYVELDTVRTGEMAQWLRQILGTRVTLAEDTARNSFMLSGTQADIKAALELIETFDQPRMRGRIARRISPAYASAAELATRLAEVLTSQGYAVSNSGSTGNASVVLMPVTAIASLFVFASTSSVMAHVEQWAKELDRPSSGPSANALFTYPVKFADAQELAKTLGDLLGGGSSAPAPAGGAAGGSGQRATSFGRVVVNNATNTLIFKGSSAEEQTQIKDLLRELDRPTKSAMIDVVVAEVQRGALESLGIKWDYNRLNSVGQGSQTVAKAGAAGFNLSYVNSASTVLAALDALATDSQARILSNPKVLARNGETASIQVGNEVPIITSQQSTATGGSFLPGNAGVIQTVQYRSTGVLLRVRPVINSGNRLDLEVSQEVSSAATTQTGVSASPTISTRRIETKLSLRDGSTILLGGLIARDDSTSDAGVPYLKDIPGLGALFRTKSNSNKQTELLVMITPYVVNDDYEAEELTQAVQATFGDWAKDVRASRVARTPELPLRPDAPPATEPLKPTQGAIGPSPELAPVDRLPAMVPQVQMPSEQSLSAVGPPGDGVEMSKPPGGASVQQATPKPASEGTFVSPQTLPQPASGLPNGTKGNVVTDPNVRDDILKLLKPK